MKFVFAFLANTFEFGMTFEFRLFFKCHVFVIENSNLNLLVCNLNCFDTSSFPKKSGMPIYFFIFFNFQHQIEHDLNNQVKFPARLARGWKGRANPHRSNLMNISIER